MRRYRRIGAIVEEKAPSGAKVTCFGADMCQVECHGAVSGAETAL